MKNSNFKDNLECLFTVMTPKIKMEWGMSIDSDQANKKPTIKTDFISQNESYCMKNPKF